MALVCCKVRLFCCKVGLLQSETDLLQSGTGFVAKWDRTIYLKEDYWFDSLISILVLLPVLPWRTMQYHTKGVSTFYHKPFDHKTFHHRDISS